MSKLTPRQRRFVAEYVIDCNGRQAAIRAGYSDRSAAEQAHDLLRKPHVQAAITALEEERARRLEITHTRVLQQLARVAFVDPRKLYGEDGRLKPVAELDEDTVAALGGMDVAMREGEPVLKVRLRDSIRALELLGRHLVLFDRRAETPQADDAEILRAAVEREKRMRGELVERAAKLDRDEPIH